MTQKRKRRGEEAVPSYVNLHHRDKIFLSHRTDMSFMLPQSATNGRATEKRGLSPPHFTSNQKGAKRSVPAWLTWAQAT